VAGNASPPEAAEIRDRWWWVEHSVWTERMLARLGDELKIQRYRRQPARRVWIPKPGTTEQRPLGIPAVRDRTVEAALRNVLEPIFERDFAESSYGFRPGRGCREAVAHVEELLSQGHVWCVDADLKSYFEHLNGLGMRILIVLDGMDHPLDCEGLTKNLWDNLAGFAKIGSVNLLATSRKPLRQLCKNASGQSSDFWERFENPPVRLKGFSSAEIAAFLKPLAAARGGLEPGVEAEFFHWTGSVPRLGVCLARRLYEDGDGPVSVGNEGVAAGWVLSEHTDGLEAAWDVCTAEEQTGSRSRERTGGSISC
jgi:hypothetical protein